MEQTAYAPANYKSDQPVRWCPGCGDHAILNSLHKAMAALGVPPHMTAVISGIGCSSRLPYYMNTYGFHTIHGRAAAIATGFKVANPEMTVWQISGDGDGLAIGGNHFIHAVRRNIDINMLLFNNKIYGLTKGQYSPTSDRGFVSKSSPYGTTEDPFIPAELVFGARGQFFARSIDVELATTQEVMLAAARHKGASVVEVLQNCVIFNNGIHNPITDKEVRADRTIHLRHGEKMLFGRDMDRGLVQDGFLLKAVKLGEDGYTIDDVLVHDAHTPRNLVPQHGARNPGTDVHLDE
ncbi:MAG: 2-oxoacid:ferredoxin oxidoreductase subunit beta, partial [Muribaculaceae bacterium]|nr:2-oxoacid:ferredoxin oxidoreductase subunit beta [Muribaculaceae bacterium]